MLDARLVSLDEPSKRALVLGAEDEEGALYVCIEAVSLCVCVRERERERVACPPPFLCVILLFSGWCLVWFGVPVWVGGWMDGCV
jgi:hypothetical protein